MALKGVEAGDDSILRKHKATQQKMVHANKVREESLKDEGRLRSIRSDLKRA